MTCLSDFRMGPLPEPSEAELRRRARVLIEGLRPVDPDLLAEFERTMEQEAIPEIIAAVDNRQRLAHESRSRWMGPSMKETTMETYWVIQNGPWQFAVQHIGGYEFCWADPERMPDGKVILHFHSQHEADMTMMAVRQLRGDLFPACLPEVPRAVQYGLVSGEGYKRRNG